MSEPTESKFGARQEFVDHCDCRTRQDLIQVIAEYIEVFTMRKRQWAKPVFCPLRFIHKNATPGSYTL